MKGNRNPLLSEFSQRLAESEFSCYRSSTRQTQYFGRFLRQEDLKGSSVLEIGSGNGVLSLLMSFLGAYVTALEPSLWSGSQDESSFLKLQSALAPEGSVSVVSTRFQEFHSESSFDLVVLHNSINHLDEELVSFVHRSDTARAAYRELLDHVVTMLKPGGVVLLADCGRLNFFGGLGMSNPFAPSIEWSLHQQPSTWVSLLESVGCQCKVEWNSLSITGWPGRLLLGNRCGAFFTTSHFTIRAEYHPSRLGL